MINNLSGDAFTDIPFFDSQFIKRNRIKSLEGNYSRKKDGDVVRPSIDFFKYSFDTSGKLINSIQVKSDFGKKDTILNYHSISNNITASLIKENKYTFNYPKNLEIIYENNNIFIKNNENKNIYLR